MTMERAITVQPRERELLKKLAGEWDLEIKARMADGSHADGKGILAAEEVARGNGVHTRLSYDVGQGLIEEDDLWSFDRWGKQVHVFSVTSDQNVHDHVGNWKDDSTLEVRWHGNLQGKDALEVMSLQWDGPDRLRIDDTVYEDGKITISSEFLATRRR